MKKSLLNGKKVKILLHLLIWAFLFIFPSYLLYVDSTRDANILFHNYSQTLIYALIFYVQYFLLIPFLFFQKKRILYFTASFLLIILMTFLMDVPDTYFMPHRQLRPREFRMIPPPIEEIHGRVPPPKPFRGWPMYNFLFTSFLVSGFSLGLRFSDKLVKNEKKRKEAEKEKLHSELAMLKNQINPHFLFNSLNTIYSLALIKSDLTPEAVMKLSDMMRYVIQDTENEKVPLEMEIQYIRHYVGLQQLRLSDNVNLQLTINEDYEDYMIPPMILIPFVENAFKYGTSSHEKTTIIIDIRIEKKCLEFKVSNQIFQGRENNETFGIGISNTRQRLRLIYPDTHELTLTNNGKIYIVNLKIPLT